MRAQTGVLLAICSEGGRRGSAEGTWESERQRDRGRGRTSRAELAHLPFFWYLTLRKARTLLWIDGTPPSEASAGREASVFST